MDYFQCTISNIFSSFSAFFHAYICVQRHLQWHYWRQKLELIYHYGGVERKYMREKTPKMVKNCHFCKCENPLAIFWLTVFTNLYSKKNWTTFLIISAWKNHIQPTLLAQNHFSLQIDILEHFRCHITLQLLEIEQHHLKQVFSTPQELCISSTKSTKNVLKMY